MKRIVLSTVAIAASFLAGYGTSSYLQKNLASSIGVGVGGALFGGGATWLYLDTKLNRQRNELQSRIDGLRKKLESSKLTENTLVTEKSALQIRIEDTTKRIAQIVSESLVTEDKINSLSDANSSLRQDISDKKEELVKLKMQLENVTSQRDEFIGKAEFKEAELISFEQEFQNKVKEETDKNIKSEVEKETCRQFELLEESEQILAEMDALVNAVYHRHQSQRHYTLGLTDKFLSFKEVSDTTSQKAYNDLLGVNQTLENQVDLLNKQLFNGLTHPVYKDYGLCSLEGKAINGLIEWVFRHLEVPLRGLDFEQNDGVISFGVDYPKRNNPNEICKKILENNETLKHSLGIHSLDRAEYIAKYDAIVISYRHTAPTPKSDDEMFKNGLLPRALFCDAIFKATDHTTSGKPTLRIMAATGEGKGICTKHIVEYFSNLEEWEVWVSDPIHGSEQDFWDCPKLAKDKSQASKIYGEFAKLHTVRKDLKIDGLTPNFVLGIFDEFDKQHDDDDKELAAKIMTAIRHTKQRQILIGQTAEVGANGWKWDDMKQCSLLVLGESIGTLCKHLAKDLGWTAKKANDVKRKYEEFSDWATKKNDSNPDTPPENITRIGLLVTGGKFQFLELPIPHKGIIRSERVRESLNVNVQKNDCN